MTRLQRAKRQTRKKWRGMLRNLPGMTKAEFIRYSKTTQGCGFCAEWRSSIFLCQTECPARAPCGVMADRCYRIYDLYHWRKPAADLCRWALREIDRVREE